MATIDNLLIAETAIVERVTAQMMTGSNAVLRKVLTMMDLASIPEEQQTVPSVSVVYDSHAVGGGSEVDLESTATLKQRWITVVAVASAVRMRESAVRNQEAGPLLLALWNALHGFEPGKGLSPLLPLTPPRAYYSAGYAYFPLAWSTSLTMCRTT